MDPMTFSLLVGESPIGAVTRFTATEELGEPYEISVEVAIRRDAPFPVAAELDRAMRFELQRQGVVHSMSGVLFGLRDLGTTETLRRLQYRLRPRISRLELTGGWAARTELSVPALARQFLAEAGYLPEERDEALVGTHPCRDLIVQADEDSLHHLLSVLAEEGLIVTFDHARLHDHARIVSCAQHSWADVPTLDGAPAHILAVGWDEAAVESIQVLREETSLQSDGVELIDRDFTRPHRVMRWRAAADSSHGPLVRRSLGQASWGGYDGERYTRSDGQGRARSRAWEPSAERRQFVGESNLGGLRSGQYLSVIGRASPGEVERFLVVHVEHEGHAPGAIVEVAHEHDGKVPTYRNRFRCIPAEQPWRPPPARRRPRMHGVALATVTGAPGASDEIVTDAHGRVMVRFHWDDVAHRGLTSAWLRVVQQWAGHGFGALFTPRVGSEVCVSFRDGSPDEPIVVGCLYNGADMPWEPLPHRREVSGIRTRSVDHGDGYNAILFGDARGAETVDLISHRDTTFSTRNDHVWRVGHDRVDEVRRARTTTVGHDDVLSVGGTLEIRAGRAVKIVVGRSELRITDDFISLFAPKVLLNTPVPDEEAEPDADDEHPAGAR